MAQERLNVAQVGSALVEEKRCSRVLQRMSGNDRHPRALAGELDAGVERLVAKARRPGQERLTEIQRIDFPPEPHAFDAFQKREPLSFAHGSLTQRAVAQKG